MARRRPCPNSRRRSPVRRRRCRWGRTGPDAFENLDRPRELGRVSSLDVGEHLLARDAPVAGERKDEVGHDGPECQHLGQQGLLDRGAGRMQREGEERVAGPLAKELAARVGERVQAHEVGLGDAYADGPGAETLGAILHRPISFWRSTIPARAYGNNVQCWIQRGGDVSDWADVDGRELKLPDATMQR